MYNNPSLFDILKKHTYPAKILAILEYSMTIFVKYFISAYATINLHYHNCKLPEYRKGRCYEEE